MPDLLPEDEATLYVLGELNSLERRQFEARLAESAELRALVHELEEGGVALSMASPTRRPPKSVWKNIAKAVSEESKQRAPRFSWWFGLWRNGWAVAAACLVGWLAYATWNHDSKQRAETSTGTPEIAHYGEAQPLIPNGENTSKTTRSATNFVTLPSPEALAKVGQITALRRQVADLETQVNQLSQALTQQQAAVSGANQLTFFNLSTSEVDSEGKRPTMSPELQRALLLALARELNLQQGFDSTNGLSGSRDAHVQFVSLAHTSQHDGATQPATEGSPKPTDTQTPKDTSTTPTPTDVATAAATTPADTSSQTTATVAGFVSGTNAVLAVDSTTSQTDFRQMTFWTANGAGIFTALGTFPTGNDPLVATIPMSSLSAGGFNVTVTAGTAANWVTPSNIVGQFPRNPR